MIICDDIQYIACLQYAAFMPAELTQHERGLAAEVVRNLDAALNRQISPAALIQYITERE